MIFRRILKTVKCLIDLHGLLHPRELAERLGLAVLEVPYRRFKGMSFEFELPVVTVDSALPVKRQYGALLHEIGHQVLHPGTTRFLVEANPFERPTKYEIEAHLFTLVYALLWDKYGFEECGYDVYRFAGMYGVPQGVADGFRGRLGEVSEEMVLG